MGGWMNICHCVWRAPTLTELSGLCFSGYCFQERLLLLGEFLQQKAEEKAFKISFSAKLRFHMIGYSVTVCIKYWTQFLMLILREEYWSIESTDVPITTASSLLLCCTFCSNLWKFYSKSVVLTLDSCCVTVRKTVQCVGKRRITYLVV